MRPGSTMLSKAATSSVQTGRAGSGSAPRYTSYATGSPGVPVASHASVVELRRFEVPWGGEGTDGYDTGLYQRGR